MRVAVTAGYDQSLPAIIAAENVRRAGHEVMAVVVSPFQISRLRTLIRRRGRLGVVGAVRKMMRCEDTGSVESGISTSSLGDKLGPLPRSLRTWSTDSGSAYRSVPSLNHDSAIGSLSEWKAELVLYCGGGILRDRFLGAVDGPVLNAHAGPLPDVRGMNAVEWSLLLDLPPAVSIHKIDMGIDTGPVFRQIPLDLYAGDTIGTLRDRAVAVGLEGLIVATTEIADGRGTFRESPEPRGRQCFALAPVLYELLEQRLAKRR